VAAELGQSKEWTTAACLGQMQLNQHEAGKVVGYKWNNNRGILVFFLQVEIFRLVPENEARNWLQEAPNKGSTMSADPLLYRFQEVSQSK